MRETLTTVLGQDDQNLLTLLHEGSEDAFTTIYNRYHKLLYVVAYTYLKSAFMAEDAVHSVFLKLWESRTSLTIQTNMRNYLYTMMKNHVLNEIRDNYTAIEKNYEITRLTCEYEDELLTKIEEQDLRKHFYNAINHLSSQKKEVCLLKLQGNLSNKEIADLMKVSVPTVKTHFSQAIKTLRMYLSKLL